MQMPPRPPEGHPMAGQQTGSQPGQQEWDHAQQLREPVMERPWPEQSGQGFIPPQPGQPESEEFNQQQGSPRARKRLRMALGLVIALALVWVLRFQVLTIRNIHVSGTSLEIWQSVAKVAGLDRSPFYFSVNEEKIREGINANRYLVYQSMEKVFPGTLNIQVLQRRPFAFLRTWASVMCWPWTV